MNKCWIDFPLQILKQDIFANILYPSTPPQTRFISRVANEWNIKINSPTLYFNNMTDANLSDRKWWLGKRRVGLIIRYHCLLRWQHQGKITLAKTLPTDKSIYMSKSRFKYFLSYQSDKIKSNVLKKICFFLVVAPPTA